MALPSFPCPPLPKNAILATKTNAELITALRVKGESEWEEQPDLYDWLVWRNFFAPFFPSQETI